MLDFYRPAASIMEPLDANQAVNDALAIANKRLEQAKIQVTARLSNELPTVRGSRNQLTQVFLNVIINAVEAMEEGGQFWIGTAYHAERAQVVTAFRDSGVGIPPEVREHLFEPFHTTKPTGQVWAWQSVMALWNDTEDKLRLRAPQVGGPPSSSVYPDIKRSPDGRNTDFSR
jgi:signal transduction histidine kinase